jgi:hypothetical protein
MDHEYTGIERRNADGGHICAKENQIDDISDDMNNVKNDINTIKTDKVHTNELLSAIQRQLLSIDKRLFIDNGTLSIQTQLRDGAARMSQIETSIKNTTDKIDDVKGEPKRYAIYTVTLISVLGSIAGAIIWLNTQSHQPVQYIYVPQQVQQTQTVTPNYPPLTIKK